MPLTCKNNKETVALSVFCWTNSISFDDTFAWIQCWDDWWDNTVSKVWWGSIQWQCWQMISAGQGAVMSLWRLKRNAAQRSCLLAGGRRRWVESKGEGTHFRWILSSILPTAILSKTWGIFWFLGEIFATIWGRIGKSRIGGHSFEFLGRPTSNPTSNPTSILLKKLLRWWALTVSKINNNHLIL